MIENGKATIRKEGYGISIKVDSKSNLFVLIFLTVWLVLWTNGFLSVFNRLFDIGNMEFNYDSFQVFWLIGWTLGGIYALFSLLWGLFGKEELIITPESSVLSKTIFGLGKKDNFNTREISNISFQEIDTSMFTRRNRWSTVGLGPGKVKFDYGMKTYSFALAVDDAEAYYLIKTIKETNLVND